MNYLPSSVVGPVMGLPVEKVPGLRSEPFERLELPHFARKACVHLGVEPSFDLDVGTGARFSTGWFVFDTGRSRWFSAVMLANNHSSPRRLLA
jgi:hypothetical protein